MANMGLERLILVEPATEIDGEARMFGVGGHAILESAERKTSLRDAIAPFTHVVGTTSSRDRALERRLISARELPDQLRSAGDLPGGASTALVFGSEVSGLRNDELTLCDPVVRIPTDIAQPTLNLAQAVLIVAYELFVATQRIREPAPHDPTASQVVATAEEIAGLFDHLSPILTDIGFARDDSFEGVLNDLRQLAARARPTPREITILRGICRRASHALGGRQDPPTSSNSTNEPVDSS